MWFYGEIQWEKLDRCLNKWRIQWITQDSEYSQGKKSKIKKDDKPVKPGH